MPHSFVSNYVHVIFSTKNRERCLTEEIRPRVWAVMIGILNNNGLEPIRIGGYDDHCHALFALPSTMSAAKAIQLLKGSSSRWISKEYPSLINFQWQKGYALFGVSKSVLESVVKYIDGQEEHHKRTNFTDEYVGFLTKHEVKFDSEYLL